MLIPSIDLKNGQVVQLVQGERLAIASDDVFEWVRKFERFSTVQLIDLDAAMGSGTNDELVDRICDSLPCRVGGGVRTVERACELLDSGATAVIVGSALFRSDEPDLDFAQRLVDRVGIDKVIGAVDSRAGQVVTHGWRTRLTLSAAAAVRELEPYCGEFLYTHVDTEGLMKGIDIEAVMTVRRATTRRLSAAGGIATQREIDTLHAAGIDAVVGMAIYSGVLAVDDSPTP